MKLLSNIIYLNLLIILSISPAFTKPLEPDILKAPTKQYNASLMIAPTTMMQKIQQKQGLFLIDIRHEKQFNTFKIPGSMNMPLSFIKTKPFLKTKPIILIHQSIAYSEMVQLVKELNDTGFQVKILQGGLAAWKHKGGTLVGDPFAQQELNKISAKTVFMEKDHEEWIILNTCQNPSEIQKKMIPKAIHTPKKIPDMVQAIFTNQPSNTPLTTVIIFNETGKDYDIYEKQINPTFGHKVFYLQGGLEEYQQFLNSNQLANKPKSQRTKEIGHCEPCKKKDNQ